MKGWFAVETAGGNEAVIDASTVSGVVSTGFNKRNIVFGSAFVEVAYTIQECLSLIAVAKAIGKDPNIQEAMPINLNTVKSMAAQARIESNVVAIDKKSN